MRRRLLVERLGERRVLASITGTVFEDANLSLQREAEEAGAPSRLIYIDANANAQLDNGEHLVIGEDDGSFEFPNLADGTYLLRLFNGTQSQTQTVPVDATVGDAAIAVTNAIQLEAGDGNSLALTSDSIVLGDLGSGSSQTVAVGDQLARMQTLPDGKVLIIGSDIGGPTSWVLDPDVQSVTPIQFKLAETDTTIDSQTPWSDLAIDADGRGVLLEPTVDVDSSEQVLGVREVNASASGPDIEVSEILQTIPSDAQVLTSQTGHHTILAWSNDSGLQLSMWNNVTASFNEDINPDSPVSLVGTTELLSFDDASGLLAVRTSDGGVSVHDMDGADMDHAAFAPLFTSSEITGPVVIDGARELLVTVSPVDSALQLISITQGALIADLAMDLSAVGQVASLALDNSSDAVVVLGAAGVAEVALTRSAAHKVTIAGGQDPAPILFGVALEGSNTAPAYSELPALETDEDTQLTLAAPGALAGAADAEGDQFVLVQRGQAANGVADVRIDGSMTYRPNPNFNGTDSLEVLLHDGRDASDNVTLDIDVNSVPDSPTGIDLDGDSIPEDAVAGHIVGDVEVIDADGVLGPGHDMDVDDHRFEIQEGQLIFLGGDINYEDELDLYLTISATDQETGETIEEIVILTIQDRNDPITAIDPKWATVSENDPGAFVAEIVVEDEDINYEFDVHTITVDDERFVVNGDQLSLKPGVAVDYEEASVIVVNVTATEEFAGGSSFTQAIKIEVFDEREQPSAILLSNETVMELVPGETVGQVSVDDAAAGSSFEFTVDDPRFEIDGSTLKLVDDQFVERASQTEIELTITAEDSQGEFLSVSEKFVIEVLENQSPYHNPENPYDVDDGGDVTALDALLIINYLNTFGPGPVGAGDPGYFHDVNGDGLVTALDALLVLNEMNRNHSDMDDTVGDGPSEGEGEQGEGEQLAEDDPVAPPAESLAEDDPVEESEPEQPLEEPNDSSKQRWFAEQDDNPQPAERESDRYAGKSSSDEFAETVDETLRTLSDDII